NAPLSDPLDMFNPLNNALLTPCQEVVPPYQEATCWNPVAKEYICPLGSNVYQFQSTGDSYELMADLEYKGASFWNPIPNPVHFDFNNDCKDSKFSAANICGDGKINPATETCDKALPRNYCDEYLGNHNWHNEALQYCNNNCTAWLAPTGYSLPPTTAECGGWCGNTVLNSGYEVCDESILPAPIGSGTSQFAQYKCQDCAWSTGGWCGNGGVEAVFGEQCDKSYQAQSCTVGGYDGVQTRSCLDDCRGWTLWTACSIAEFCGNNAVDGADETCDGTAPFPGNCAACRVNCTCCGDGNPDVAEECDDGNGNNTDACLNNCTIATCGDGYVWAGPEDCDDANTTIADGCVNCSYEVFTITSTSDITPLEIGDTFSYNMEVDTLDPAIRYNFSFVPPAPAPAIWPPAWLTVNTITGLITGTPTHILDDAGVFTISAVAVQSIYRTPANNSPQVFNIIVNSNFAEGADWPEGTPSGVDITGDTLKLSSGGSGKITPYIWIADSQNNDVIQVATGEILGESAGQIIRTIDVDNIYGDPANDCISPSRTTVDLDSNGWVACRDDADVGKIDVIKINKNTGSIECAIKIDTEYGARGLATNADGDIIVGFRIGGHLYKINTETCNIIGGPFSSGLSVYGLSIDGDGYMWMSDPSARVGIISSDFLNKTAESGLNWPYGLVADSNGNGWYGAITEPGVYKFTKTIDGMGGITLGKNIFNFSSGAGRGGVGIAVDKNGYIWTTLDLDDEVVLIDPADGSVISYLPVGKNPTGVTGISNGKVWIVSRQADGQNSAGEGVVGDITSYKYDPVTGIISPPTGYEISNSNNLYTYSDMAGFSLFNITLPALGTWTLDFDSKHAGTDWTFLKWADKEPLAGMANTNVWVTVRTSPNGATWSGDYDFDPAGAYSTAGFVSRSEDLNAKAVPDNRYIQIVFTLDTPDETVSPELDNVIIEFEP
ncbi:hypothetical protein KKD20_03885, partial [Patescibacteria group bacterium]|nr:hypothetical protein [Patescibacteria group bacterium]